MTGNYSDIGAQLKKKRTEANRVLEDISEELKVSTVYLQAIEDGRIKDLPSIIYYKLYVRSYAQELGLNPEVLLEDIEEITAPRNAEKATEAKTESTTIKKPTKPKAPKEMSMTKLAIILAAVVFIGFIIIMYLVISDEESKPLGINNPVADNYEKAAAPESTLVADEAPILIAIQPQPQPPSVQPMELKINIRQTSWLLVLADGDTVLNRNLEPGDSRRLTADYRFAVSMGNPNGVEMKLNDTLLGPLSESGRPVRNLEINQLNKKDYYYRPTDSSDEEN